jgi:hypothetical protein
LDHFSAAVQHAITEAPNTADRWGAPVNRDDRASGGLHYSTYKALCRRDGLFTNSQGLHDWNMQLTDPIIKSISNGWERTFSRRMPSVLNGLANKSGALLTAFHETVEAHVMRNGTSLASLEMLKQQLPTYRDSLKDLSSAAQSQTTTRQKDINREFVPVVAGAMHQAYEDCENERGQVSSLCPRSYRPPTSRRLSDHRGRVHLHCTLFATSIGNDTNHSQGSFRRMKTLMIGHVDRVRQQMFNDSTNAVKKSLKKMVKDIEDFLLGKADEIFISVKRDYESVVLGRKAASHQLPREQRQIRADVNDIIEGTELVFKKAVGLEPETPEPEDPESPIEASEQNKAPPKREEVEQYMAIDGVEKVKESNNHITTEAVMAVDQPNDGTAAMENIGGEAVDDPDLEMAESRPPNLPLQEEELEQMKADELLADTPVAHKPTNSQKPIADPLAERSDSIKIPASVDENKPSPENAGNLFRRHPSVSTDDGAAAIDLEAGERGFGYSRSSSVASWVQSWFSA